MYVNNFISIMKGIIYCNQKKKQMKNPFTPINRYIKCCLQAYFALTKSPVYTTTFSLYATIFLPLDVSIMKVRAHLQPKNIKHCFSWL